MSDDYSARAGKCLLERGDDLDFFRSIHATLHVKPDPSWIGPLQYALPTIGKGGAMPVNRNAP
ncbi:hypothetical protein GCM10011499_39950 [Pelagibacterium lentulum]|uniref:Uncharacterized protein n=1 Tax=Pelagibacterium lentulum TaxID=2029865 RepID=A0A916RR68_9HYPH|nr:hypothetical protein GCM10011499_39950 [Pelagibacterium lentulum]